MFLLKKSARKLVQNFAVFGAVALLVFPAFSQGGSTVDLTFDAAVARDSNSASSRYIRPKVALQPDGKILVFSFQDFNNVAGISKNVLARLNADGSLDTSFTCACENFTYINNAVVQLDGKIIIAGGWYPTTNARMARLNSDGSLDNSFTSPFNQPSGSFGTSANVWAVLPDGKIIASTGYGGFHVQTEYLYRLNSNGSIDNSFAYLSFDGWGGREFFYNVMPVADGKLMICGKHQFGYLFRVNTDGTKDMSFESPTLAPTQPIPNSFPYIYDFDFQSDGKIVVLGSFSSINGVPRVNLARLNADGSVDLQFSNSFFSNGQSLEVISGDKILLTLGTPSSSLFRLNADGSADNSFASTMFVSHWILESMERIVFVGDFAKEGVTSQKVGRIN